MNTNNFNFDLESKFNMTISINNNNINNTGYKDVIDATTELLFTINITELEKLTKQFTQLTMNPNVFYNLERQNQIHI